MYSIILKIYYPIERVNDWFSGSRTDHEKNISSMQSTRSRSNDLHWVDIILLFMSNSYLASIPVLKLGCQPFLFRSVDFSLRTRKSTVCAEAYNGAIL